MASVPAIRETTADPLRDRNQNRRWAVRCLAFAEGAADRVQTIFGCGVAFRGCSGGVQAVAVGIGIHLGGKCSEGSGFGEGANGGVPGCAGGSTGFVTTMVAEAIGPTNGLLETIGIGGLTGWVKDDKAARTDAGGGGCKARGDESEVEQAALAGVHRGKDEGLAGCLDGGDGGGGGGLNGGNALGLEVAGVKRELVDLLGLEPEDGGGEAFDCVEEIAVALEQKRRVRAGEGDFDKGWLRGGGIGIAAVDGVFKAQATGRPEHFEEAGERRFGGAQWRHRRGCKERVPANAFPG